MSLINKRKHDHITAIARDPEIERHDSGFDRIQLTHRALPELDYTAIDTSCTFLNHHLSFPLIISSMTGGDSEITRGINIRLAKAAEHCGVAMAVGSQRIALNNPKAIDSFSIRRYAPNIPLLANLGAVQLNDGFGHTEAQTAIDMLTADGLYLHLNPLQEIIQKATTIFLVYKQKFNT